MGISDSRFNMWRAVVAMIHADNVVQPHEINFIVENTKNLPMSIAQAVQLAEDARSPFDIGKAYDGITNPRDKEDFFRFARAIAWSDGDFDAREQDFLNRISATKADREIMEHAVKIFDDMPSEERTLKSVLSNLLSRAA